MKTYVLRFKGLKTKHSVKANTLAEAKKKMTRGSDHAQSDVIFLKGDTEKKN